MDPITTNIACSEDVAALTNVMTRVVYHGEHPNTEDPDTFVNRRHQISGGTDTYLSLRNYTETFMNNCYRRRQPFTYTLFRTDTHVASSSSTHCFRRDSNGRPPTLASHRDRTLSHPQNLSHICIPRGQFHNERHRRPARGQRLTSSTSPATSDGGLTRRGRALTGGCYKGASLAMVG